MRITFIDPPVLAGKRAVERVFGCTYSLYPIPNIFALSNAALLEKNGFAVHYFDMANEGWSQQKFKRFLLSDGSDIYVLHSVNLSEKNDLSCAEMMRTFRKNSLLVFTGPAPTYFVERFLKDKNTLIVRGESELTLLELVKTLDKRQETNQIAGISFKKNGNIMHNPARPLIENLNDLPFPARHLANKNLYCNPKLLQLPFTALQTSRNCSYRCLFCVPNSFNFAVELEYRRYHQNRKPPVRVRSASSVIEEFASLKANGYRSVSIIDDQFLWEEARTISICEGISKLGMEWGCLARADRISEKIVRYLAAAHCRYVDIGVESFNQAVLDDIRKDLKIPQIEAAIFLLKKYAIGVKINLVFGVSPLQNKAVIERDISWAKKLNVDAVMFSLATPFPGTDFYQRAYDNRWFIGKDYYSESVQQKSIISYPDMPGEKLERLVKKANLSFYFRPRVFKKNLGKFFRLKNLFVTLRALKRKFF